MKASSPMRRRVSTLWRTWGHGGRAKPEVPSPWDANVIRKDLGSEVVREVSRLLGQSIVYALENRKEALDHAMAYARDLSREKADVFVGMYVNEWTRAYGDAGRRAVSRLLGRAAEAGVIPERIEPEFVSPSIA